MLAVKPRPEQAATFEEGPHAAIRWRAMALIDSVVLALLLAGFAVTVPHLGNAITGWRIGLLLSCATFAPGWAILTRLPATDLLTGAALAVGFSAAVEILATLVIGIARWWHPGVVAALLGAGSTLLIFIHLLGLIRAGRRQTTPAQEQLSVTDRAERPAVRDRMLILTLVGFLCAAGVLWALSLPGVRVHDLGRDGLVTALPLEWYLGLGLVVVGGTFTCWSRRFNGFVMAGYLAVLVLVLYATLPALTGSPDGVWVFKHIGVTRYVALHGGPNLGLDVYNNWPGFFTLAAAFQNLSGQSLLSLAPWAEPFFALLIALLIAALAQAISRNFRVGAFTAFLFTLGDWVHQVYFAPQTIALVVSVALLIVFIRGAPEAKARMRLVSLLSRVLRREQHQDRFAVPLRWGAWTVALLALTLDLALVLTHQLSPYIVLLETGVLLALGVVHGWRLWGTMVVLTVVYLIPYFGFLQSHYGAISSFDPLSNLLASGSGEAWGWSTPVLGSFGSQNIAALNAGVQHLSFFMRNAGGAGAHASPILTLASIVTAIIAAIRYARSGFGWTTLVVLALALAPAGVLFGLDYGGEANARVYLFSSIWRDLLVALAILTLTRLRWRLTMALLVSVIFAVLFVPAYFGNAELTIVPKAEVAASTYFEEHAPAHSVLMLAAPDFPNTLTARYPLFVDQLGEFTPKHVIKRAFWRRLLGAADVRSVIRQIRGYSPFGFLVFARSEYRYARLNGLAPPGALGNLEIAVARSRYFRLWFHNSDARIYELTRQSPLLVRRRSARRSDHSRRGRRAVHQSTTGRRSR